MKDRSILGGGAARRLGAATLGALLGCCVAVGARADFTIAYTTAVEERPAVVYNSVEDEYLSAWIDADSGAGPAVKVQRLEAATGAHIGGPVTVLAPGIIPYFPTWKPTLAYSPATNAYLIGVNATYGPAVHDNFLVVGAFHGGTLAELERYVLFVGSDFYDDWWNGSLIGLTYNELDDEFLITYQRTIDAGLETHYVITSQRYEIGTGPLGSETDMINNGINGIKSHDVAYSTFIAALNPPDPPVLGSTYLLATHGTELSLFLVDPSGTAVQGIPFRSGISGSSNWPSITTGRVPGMTHDYWLVTWIDTNNACWSGGFQYIEGCADGTLWSGVYGSFFDPWRFVYGPGPDNVAFPISMLPHYSYFSGLDATYNAADEAFHVAWQAVPIDDPLNEESRSHIRFNTVDSFITSYPAPQPYPNYVVSDITGTCPSPGSPCTSDQDPLFPAIAASGDAGALVVWEQLYPPNPADHDIFGDLVLPVPEPDPVITLALGCVLLAVLNRRSARPARRATR